jgi:hypothetical protein
MQHRVKGFYPFKGLFMSIDIRVCERLLSQMPESKVMEFRGKFHSLISEFYGELAAVKAGIEEYELTLNTLDENAEAKTEPTTENIEESLDSSTRKRLKS